MVPLRHIIVFLCYAGPAAGLGFALSQWPHLIDRGTAVGAGVALLLAGGLLHEVRARIAREARLGGQFLELRQAVFHLQEELTWSRRETRTLGEALEAVARSGHGGQDAPAVEEVMAEVRVLKSLVRRLSESAAKRTEDRAVAAAGRGGSVPAAQAAPAARPKAAPLVLVPLPREVDEEAVLDVVREALRDDRIGLVLQPIVSLPPRKRCFYECFSRLKTKSGTTVLPEDYIAIAEREGLITAIDNMLLLRCIQLLRKIQRRGEKLGFFCNISPHTLKDEDFFGDFVAFLERNEELAPNLIFEFSQADFADRGLAESRHLERLATLGCRFSLDQVTDLGLEAGALAERRVRFVKLDAEVLLAEAARDEEAPRALKRHLVREGIDLIVGKVEAEEVLVELLDYDIEFGQGFLFGEPRAARLTD